MLRTLYHKWIRLSKLVLVLVEPVRSLPGTGLRVLLVQLQGTLNDTVTIAT